MPSRMSSPADRPAGDTLLRLFAALRSAFYAAAFLLLWGWLALSVRGFDPRLGGSLPGWTPAVGPRCSSPAPFSR